MKRTRKNDKRKALFPVVALTALIVTIVPLKICGEGKTEIDVPEITSYTSVSYAEPFTQAQVETSEPEVIRREVIMFTTCNVHLRESDSGNSMSLKIVPASQIVTAWVVNNEDDWYEVSYKGIQGYMCSEYLREYDTQLHLDIGLDYVHQDLVREMIELLQIDVDEYFFYGMMYTENRFQNEPESKAGAQGILQIMPATWKMLYESFQKEYPDYSHLLINDPTDKTSNIILGMYCIYYLQQNYGFDSTADNAHAILTAYNRGLSGANKYYREHGTYETSYSQEILRAAEYIREHKTWKEGL